MSFLEATPHKDRMTALYEIYLRIFRHLTQKPLDIRQYACVIFMQADEKSVCVSFAQSLCGIALKYIPIYYNIRLVQSQEKGDN